MQTQKLTNLQMELLKLFSYELDLKQLEDIKNLLAQYFAQQATQSVDQLWEEQGWNNETMEEWAEEHLRSHGTRS